MEGITTEQHDLFDVNVLPPVLSEVVRFKISANLYSKYTRKHPAITDAYAELLLSGTGSRTREALINTLESLGVLLSVNASDTFVTISVTVLETRLKETLAVLEDILSDSLFTPKEIIRVKKKVTQDLVEEADDAMGVAHQKFVGTLYSKDHPLHTPSIERRQKDIVCIDRASILEFHTYFLSTKWYVSVSGTVNTAAEVVHSLECVHAASVIKPNQTTTKGIASKQQKLYATLPSKANVELYIGNYLPLTNTEKDFLPFTFGLNVLAKPGGFSGRLMSTVREKEGLTYRIYGKTEGVTGIQEGAWYIYTFFTPKDLHTGIRATKQEIKKIVDHGVTAEEMKKFKMLLHNQFQIAHESSTRMLHLYHSALLSGQTSTDVKKNIERLGELKKADVNRALRLYIKPSKLLITGAGPVTQSGTSL